MSKRSLSASAKGQELLRKALERQNLTQKALVDERGIASWSTVNRLFNGKPTQRQLFLEVCEELNLNWEDVAEYPEEEVTPLLELWLQLIAVASPTENMGLVLAKEETLGWGKKIPSRYEKSVRLGSHTRFEIKLETPGYLLLLQKDTLGEVYCFCPSCFAPHNKLEVGVTILPQADSPITSLPIEGEPGQEQILAIITPEVPNLQWLPTSNDEPLELNENYLVELFDYVKVIQEAQVLYTEYQILE